MAHFSFNFIPSLCDFFCKKATFYLVNIGVRDADEIPFRNPIGLERILKENKRLFTGGVKIEASKVVNHSTALKPSLSVLTSAATDLERRRNNGNKNKLKIDLQSRARSG